MNKPVTLKELDDLTIWLSDAALIADRLPANDNRHMALVVALHSASAIADQLDDEARHAHLCGS